MPVFASSVFQHNHEMSTHSLFARTCLTQSDSSTHIPAEHSRKSGTFSIFEIQRSHIYGSALENPPGLYQVGCGDWCPHLTSFGGFLSLCISHEILHSFVFFEGCGHCHAFPPWRRSNLGQEDRRVLWIWFILCNGNDPC